MAVSWGEGLVCMVALIHDNYVAISDQVLLWTGNRWVSFSAMIAERLHPWPELLNAWVIQSGDMLAPTMQELTVNYPG